ncbi:MAG: sel1 repeat family protein [Alphaproteobacteria bacterium]|nr:sel1 repeat family protein [Alphaproteobacteria bacterium]
MGGTKQIKLAVFAACAALWAVAAGADYTDGVIASRKISMDAGLRIWRKAAWNNDDFLSEMQLGDTYGSENGDNKFYDPVESYVWYYLATRSTRIGENVGDGYARRVISNDVHRAFARQNKLMVLLSAEERQDARDRIVYILSCRGADGFLRLGQIHTTGQNTSGYGNEYSNDSPSTYGGLSDWAHSYDSFRDRSEREFSYGEDAQARQMMGVSSTSVIVKNDGEALTYFHIADNMGHPLAREYLRGLDRGVRRARPLGDRIADEAGKKARYWTAPFEFYPAGGNASGVPYTDECYIGLDRQRALVLAATGLPPKDVEHALVFLGWTPTGQGVQRFQATLVEAPTGKLTAAQSVRAIQMAALRGDAPSQNALGVMYAHGVGVIRNYVRAESWFKKAADQRYGAALYHLGVLYKVGPDGIHQDLSKANDYFTASALAGFRPTMNQLGDLLAVAASRPSH